MTPNEQQKIVMPLIKDLMKSLGYGLSSPYEKEFTKDVECGSIKISLFFSRTGLSSISPFRICHTNVESPIIHKIGLPNIKLESYKAGKNILYTISDKETHNPYADNLKMGTPSKSVKNEKDAVEFAEFFKDYVQNEGNTFITKYQNLNNVLEKINELEKAGESLLKFVDGTLDHFFRVLIISKICDDPDHSKKLHHIDNIFSNPKYENWEPYYSRLKNVLENIDHIQERNH